MDENKQFTINGVVVEVGMKIPSPGLDRFLDHSMEAANAIKNIEYLEGPEAEQPTVQNIHSDGLVSLVLGGHTATCKSDQLVEKEEGSNA